MVLGGIFNDIGYGVLLVVLIFFIGVLLVLGIGVIVVFIVFSVLFIFSGYVLYYGIY